LTVIKKNVVALYWCIVEFEGYLRRTSNFCFGDLDASIKKIALNAAVKGVT
jgi:hypothetical protein